MKKTSNIERTTLNIKDGGIKILEYLIKDINKLGKQAKVSINEKWFMVYTLIGTEGDYRGFKVIRIPTSEIFVDVKNISLQWVTLDLKHWITGLGYLGGIGKLVLSHVAGEENVFNIDIMDSVLELSYGCDNPDSIRNISWEEVEGQLAAISCEVEISTTGEAISKAKKLMKMSEDEIIVLKHRAGKAFIGTNSWTFEIGNTLSSSEKKDTEFTIRGKYINSISSKSDHVTLAVYENRVAVRDNSLLPSLYLFPLELMDI